MAIVMEGIPVLRTIALTLTVLFLSGCKLAVILVEGGEVQSIGSGTCMTSPTVPQTGTVCIHEVPDSTYSETFTAVADTGWDFVKWNSGGGFSCADSAIPTCEVTMVPLAGVPGIDAAIAADNTVYIMPIFERVAVEFLVQPDSIFLVNGLVSELWVLVAPEWLESDVVSLAIDITGINAGFHEHGYQELRVSATALLGVDQGQALVSVDWPIGTDPNLTHSPETYTACIQAMVNGLPFGAENCTSFGPF
jgi:hypothetical protein